MTQTAKSELREHIELIDKLEQLRLQREVKQITNKKPSIKGVRQIAALLRGRR